MKTLIAIALLAACSLVQAQALIDGAGFLKIGNSRTEIEQHLKRTKAKIIGRDDLPCSHKSACEHPYENVKLTDNFTVGEAALFFHNEKLYMVHLESKTLEEDPKDHRKYIYSPKRLRLELLVDALREKYKFTVVESKSTIEKPWYKDGMGCTVPVEVKEKKWSIDAQPGISATYVKTDATWPGTTDEMTNGEEPGYGCSRSYQYLSIADERISEQVRRLDEAAEAKAAKRNEILEAKERASRLKGL